MKSSFQNLLPSAVVLSVCLFFASCGNSPEDGAATGASQESSSDKPLVHVTNYPLLYFAERIGGDLIELHFLAGKKKGDPSFWKPTDEEILQMQGADLVLINGATYEKWLDAVSLPTNVTYDTSDAFAGEFLSSGEVITHSHGEDGEHTHGGIAGTTWMDFQQAIWQAEEVHRALSEFDPENESAYTEGFNSLADDLDALHQEFKAVGLRLKEVPLVGSHPVYQYLARRYYLGIESVHWEPDVAPGDEGVNELKEILETHPAKWMIWEGSPIEKSVKLLEGMGIDSVVIDPCGNRPDSGDWLTVMRENLENLKTVAIPTP